jgi:hypothetical protein
MTVTSTNYSSLEEVWGDNFNPTNKTGGKKEKKKKVIDPICELYEMGNNNGYTENDLVHYANSYLENYDKTSYSRGMNSVSNEEEKMHPHSDPRERPQRRVAISSNRAKYDVSSNDDEDEMTTYVEEDQHRFAKNKRSSPRHIKKEEIESYDDDYSDSSNKKFAFIDLLLYIVSGIILIFVMEQFVRIGLLLQ